MMYCPGGHLLDAFPMLWAVLVTTAQCPQAGLKIWRRRLETTNDYLIWCPRRNNGKRNIGYIPIPLSVVRTNCLSGVSFYVCA